MEDQRALIDGLLEAYRQGFFPMAAGRRSRAPIRWYSPDPRTIIPLEPEPARGGPGFHIPRSLARVVRQARFAITTDTSFERVIRACAEPRASDRETWIDDRIIQAYTALHRAGHAHAIEAWSSPGDAAPRLVGGLYGVRIGAAFFAESKFSRPGEGGANASKVCLVHLVHHLRRRGFTLLDVQFSNPHLEQFGATDIPRAEFLKRLAEAIDRAVQWLPFEPQMTILELARSP